MILLNIYHFSYMGCRRIFQIFYLLISLLACFVIYSIIFKPDFVFDPVKQLLNKPYPSILEKHLDLKIDVNQLNLGKDSSITLSEDQVFNVINDSLPQAAISRVELEENRIILFRNVADKGEPLWLVVEFTVEGNTYRLDKIGFGWLKVPDIFKDRVMLWINESFSKLPGFKITDFLGGELGLLLNPEYIKIKKDNIDVRLIGIDSSKFKGLVDSIDPHKYNQGIEETIKEISDSIKNFQKSK